MPMQSGGQRAADVSVGMPDVPVGIAATSTGGSRPQSDPRIPIEVVLAAHLGPDRRKGIEAYVQYLARCRFRVGMVSTGPEGTYLRCALPITPAADAEAGSGAAARPVEARDRKPFSEWSSQYAPRQDWAAAILEGEAVCDRLVIVGTPKEGREDVDLLGLAPGVVLLCEGTEPGQLAAYRALKQYQPWLQERPLMLFVLDSVDVQDGAATGRRLEQLAERFLALPMHYTGCTVRQTSIRQVLAAQDILGVVDGEAHERWLSTVQNVIDRMGRPPRMEPSDTPDGFAEASTPEAVPRNASVEIEFAIPVDAPLRNVELIEGFVLEHITAFCSEAKGCERIPSPPGQHDAGLLRAVLPNGVRRILVISAGPSPGVLERLFAMAEGIANESEIIWVGSPPTDEQQVMLDRLELAVHYIRLRHVCVDGRIGVLVERAE